MERCGLQLEAIAVGLEHCRRELWRFTFKRTRAESSGFTPKTRDYTEHDSTSGRSASLKSSNSGAI